MQRIIHPFFLLFTFCFIGVNINAQTPEQLADSLRKVLPKQKEDSNKVNLLIEICNNVSYYNLDEAITYGLQGLALSKKIGYRKGTSKMAYILGFVYADQNKFKESANMYDEAEQIAIAEKNQELLGKISNGRGSWHFMQSDFFNASYHYSKACEYFQLIKDTSREIIAYQNLIATIGSLENYDKSIKLSLELVEKVNRLNDSSQIAFAYNHLIVAYLGIKKTDEAAKYVPYLRAYIAKTSDLAFAADSYSILGLYYERRGEYDTALMLHKTGLNISLRENFQPAYLNLAIGRTYLKKKDLPNAYYYLNEALVLSKKSKSIDVQYRVSAQMSTYYAAINDYKNAYKYSIEYEKLNDSVLAMKTRQYASFLEASFENSKKEKQISALELSNTQNELAVVRRNRMLIITGLLAITLLSILGFLYRVSQQKRTIAEKDKILQQEQIKFLERQQQVVSLQSMVNGQETERTRIAKDLHDGLGGLFSTVKMHFSTLQHEQQELQVNPLFSKSYELINTASEEVRRIAHNMMPEVLLKMGVLQATQELCNSISAGKLLKVTMQSYGMEKRLNASTEIMLFRIIQELLNNIIKHAQATEAIVQFNKDGNRLSVTVEDNGRGFNTKETDEKITAGLSSVQSRVQYLNGELSIDSQTEIGTTILMNFLINEEEQLS